MFLLGIAPRKDGTTDLNLGGTSQNGKGLGMKGSPKEESENPMAASCTGKCKCHSCISVPGEIMATLTGIGKVNKVTSTERKEEECNFRELEVEETGGHLV